MNNTKKIRFLAVLTATFLSARVEATSCTQVYDYYVSIVVDHAQWDKPVASIDALLGVEAIEKNSNHEVVDSFLEGFSRVNLETTDGKSWLRRKLTVSSWLTSGPSTELTDPKITLIVQFNDGTVKLQNLSLQTKNSFIHTGFKDFAFEAILMSKTFESEVELGAPPSANNCFRIQTRSC